MVCTLYGLCSRYCLQYNEPIVSQKGVSMSSIAASLLNEGGIGSTCALGILGVTYVYECINTSSNFPEHRVLIGPHTGPFVEMKY